jgi:hypothetical protein
MLALAETAEYVADADASRQMLELLGPYPGQIGDIPQTVVGTVDLALAGAALTTGALSLAEQAAARAVAASRERNTPIFLGRELVRLAAARQRGGAKRDEIVPLVDEALVLADSCGAGLIRHEAARYELL